MSLYKSDIKEDNTHIIFLFPLPVLLQSHEQQHIKFFIFISRNKAKQYSHQIFFLLSVVPVQQGCWRWWYYCNMFSNWLIFRKAFNLCFISSQMLCGSISISREAEHVWVYYKIDLTVLMKYRSYGFCTCMAVCVLNVKFQLQTVLF